MITPWHEPIALNGIIQLFVLIQEYASTMNKALIIAYDKLCEENLKLSKFGNNDKKMMNHIQGSSQLIQACGEQVSRQTFIITNNLPPTRTQIFNECLVLFMSNGKI